MKFLDEAKVYVESGHGGSGCLSFRREKFIEFGGPDGGNGGRGGDVRVVCRANLNTLIDFRYQQHFRAKAGRPGMGKNRHGGKGADTVLYVPLGTQILSEDKTTVLADLCRDGEDMVLLAGGRGGMGNAHFKSSTNRAPRITQPGEAGEQRDIWLQLKTIADVGLIGKPNAGKSSLLSALSRARPKVADYPFTTLRPHLGVLQVHDRTLVVADIPGLIEGAHEGLGLGDRFLKHGERCSLLIYVIGLDDPDPAGAWQMLRHEIETYNPAMAEKASLLVLNKKDLVDEESLALVVDSLKTDLPLAVTSCLTAEGIAELKQVMVDLVGESSAPTNLTPQNDQGQDEGDGIGHHDGRAANENPINQPQDHAGGKQQVHHQGKGPGIPGFQDMPHLGNKGSRGAQRSEKTKNFDGGHDVIPG
jgi:GTP-binding protein